MSRPQGKEWITKQVTTPHLGEFCTKLLTTLRAFTTTSLPVIARAFHRPSITPCVHVTSPSTTLALCLRFHQAPRRTTLTPTTNHTVACTPKDATIGPGLALRLLYKTQQTPVILEIEVIDFPGSTGPLQMIAVANNKCLSSPPCLEDLYEASAKSTKSK